MIGLLDAPTEKQTVESIMQEAGYVEEAVEEAVVEESPQEEMLPQVEESQENEISMVPEEEPQQEMTELDVQFIEAEKRLSKAILYRQLINGRFFDGTTQLVLEVETELKEFVKTQYLKLSGSIPQDQPKEKLFEDEEVIALKQLASRILNNPTALDSKPRPVPQPKPPTTQKLVAAPVKQIKAPSAPVTPVLKQRPIPKEAEQAKPVVKAAAKPAQKPLSKPIPKPKAVLTIPEDESIVEERGKRYRVKYTGMNDLDEFGIMDGGICRKTTLNGTAVLSNGIQIVKKPDGVFKIIKTLLANNAQTPQRLPFPSNEEMPGILEQQAQMAANKLPPNLGSILGR